MPERVDVDHPAWPVGLADLAAPPACLFVEGPLPDPARPAVALVGTRTADPDGLDLAQGLARSLAAAGIVVVSGGARGIDAAAHRGALQGAAGSTVVVLAMGLDQPVPSRQSDLLRAVRAGGGAVVTEHPPDVPAAPFRFLERNRLVAAWASATVLVQAPARSGALSTAAWARELGRPVLAVPAAPWDRLAAGNLRLLAECRARLCRGVDDVLAALDDGLGPGGDWGLPGTAQVPGGPGSSHRAGATRTADRGSVRRRPPPPPDDPDARAVLAVLTRRPRHPDELVARLGLPAPRLQRALLLLALAGRAEEREGGRWARAADAPREVY